MVEGESHRRKHIAIKSTQIFLLAAIILMSLFITVLCIGFLVHYEVETNVWNVDSVRYWNENLAKEQTFWFDDGIEELKSALKINWEQQKSAKNLIIFVTHGIGATALAAVRFNQTNGSAGKMVWEDFSHIGYIKTNCTATSKCDAYSLGTALFGGVETTQEVGGVDSSVSAQNCSQSTDEVHHIKSILQMAQNSNFRNGFITTKRISGPMMSSLYARTINTSWECDSAVPSSKILQGCRDIATQLIDDEIGIGMNVIMGGGRQTLMSSIPVSDWDPIDPSVCNSRDGRNYIRDWRILKRLGAQKNAVVQNISELIKLNGSNVDFVLGVFANGNIVPRWWHNTTDNHMPDLQDMVEKALTVLNRKNERFLLVVESGNERSNDLDEQIKQLKRLNETIYKAMSNFSDETLLMTLFVESGTIPTKSELPKETIAGNSQPGLTTIDGITGNIRMLTEGPSSYLFNGLHDETYIAHALSFALKIGPFQKPDNA